MRISSSMRLSRSRSSEAVGAAAAAWPGAGDGVDLNLTADGTLQRAFSGRRTGEIIVLHKELYGLGLLFFSTS